ncbi:hypothetical protein J0895_08645 [Phormidium pseudopriestleyi FRX01]|uniref:Uncharacterized protein n=1 Tax=Phormidium pseudopriestleyi FRX01 TaxID=1759528 RepID=A0ABS3FPX3_9CYAN|nr:hypothetical protein [Phormidium pseudopriestleyi]MBO0349169.1 hypothetical protein [Phormidium pseudopriestleyi FRX01]
MLETLVVRKACGIDGAVRRWLFLLCVMPLKRVGGITFCSQSLLQILQGLL